MNPYLELGITPTATLEELKRAYRQAVLRYHPDTARGRGNPEKFNAVLQAYQLLKQKYDKSTTAARLHRAAQTKAQTAFAQRSPTQNAETTFHWLVDDQTSQIPLQELIFCLENTENPYVRMVAIEAIAMKKNPAGIQYLLDLLPKTNAMTQRYIIRVLGQKDLYQVHAHLFAFIFSPDLDIALEAIKALEKINQINRGKVLSALKREFSSPWRRFCAALQQSWQLVLGHVPPTDKLGSILLKHHKISEEQLELSLLLQKRFHLLLGQILRQLDYLSLPEIQQAISLQKAVG